MEKQDKRHILGITIGDMNGVGPELILKTFEDKRMFNVCTPVIYGSSRVLSYHRKALNLPESNFNLLRADSPPISNVLNVINCWDEEAKIELGTISDIAGQYAFLAVKKGVAALVGKKIEALVTAPINKKTTSKAEEGFTGHTEYLKKQYESKDVLMLLCSGQLRVGTVTGHIPIKEVAASITLEVILSKIRIFAKSLRMDFGIDKPKLAVLGLNPHAGDSGLIGKEEIEIIGPAIKKANEDGHVVFGPYSPDGLFGSNNFSRFDGILAMYHDQGLIPFKTIAFDSGINFTAGLPGIRTSPDHGPAYDIAGKNKTSIDSFRNALYAAIDIVKQRINYTEANKNSINKVSVKESISR